MSEPITTSTDVLNDHIDEIERLERRVAELEAVLKNARLAMLDVDTVNPAIARSYRQIVETLGPSESLGYEFEKAWDENLEKMLDESNAPEVE